MWFEVVFFVAMLVAAEVTFFTVLAIGKRLVGWNDVEVDEHELTEDCWCHPRVLTVEGDLRTFTVEL